MTRPTKPGGPPDLFSEPFSPMGNVVAEGVWNQLGRPELDRLTLLIRESVQNAWDARVGLNIKYDLRGFSLDLEQRAKWRAFFGKVPAACAYEARSKVVDRIVSLSSWLEKESPRLLVVSDRKTTGLDGPTRADRATEDTKRNFVDFLRNIGQPPGKAETGGTFGYGKAAFYLASETRTILVYSRCLHGGRLESRLTAAALTHNYADRGVRYTGRHWWGRIEDHVVEPILDEEADVLAKSLGLPGFTGKDCGTSIAITEPAFEDHELNRLGEICLRHLWPKLESPDHAHPPIALSLVVSGVQVDVPRPSKTPPYDAFWRALRELKAAQSEPEGKTVQAIKYGKDSVGLLALERSFITQAPRVEQESFAHEMSPQHVALLRGPELVVKYLDAGRGLGNDHIGFVGVFKCDGGVDEVFAQSEPPTHDDWQPGSVADKRARGIVTQTLKRVREAARTFATLYAPRTKGVKGTPLARLADEFALLAPGIGPNSPSDRSGGKAGAKTPKRGARPQVGVGEGDASLVDVDGAPHAVFAFDVTHAQGSESTRLTAEVFPVLCGGGREGEAPVGTVFTGEGWWTSPRGARLKGNEVVVGPRQQGTWTFHVPVQGDAAVGVDAKVEVADRSGEADVGRSDGVAAPPDEPASPTSASSAAQCDEAEAAT